MSSHPPWIADSIWVLVAEESFQLIKVHSLIKRLVLQQRLLQHRSNSRIANKKLWDVATIILSSIMRIRKFSKKILYSNWLLLKNQPLIIISRSLKYTLPSHFLSLLMFTIDSLKISNKNQRRAKLLKNLKTGNPIMVQKPLMLNIWLIPFNYLCQIPSVVVEP